MEEVRIFVVDPKTAKVDEFDSQTKAKVAQRKSKNSIIVHEQDDLKVLSTKQLQSLVSKFRGDEATIDEVALPYRVFNLLVHWAGNRKITLKESKVMTVKKKAVVKKAVVKKAVSKKAAVKKAVAKKAAAPKGGGKGVDIAAFTKDVRACLKDKLSISEAYKTLRAKYKVASVNPLLKKAGINYRESLGK